MAMKENQAKLSVAAVVVIVVLLASYLFISSSGSAALAAQDYSHATGNLTLSVTQSTGSDWAVAYVLFVPAGTAYLDGVPLVDWNSSVSVQGGLASGRPTSVTLPVSGPVAFGTRISGSAWSKYQINAGGTFYYAQLAVVNASAA